MPIYVDGSEIELVEVFKYLGVYLDSQLTFDYHINVMHKKASKKLGALRKTREFVDQSTALMLYKSLVLPHFDYCDTVYMTTNAIHLNKLQLIQNSACRTILLAESRTSTEWMHNELGLLKLNDRRMLHLCFQLHKNIYVDNSSSLSKFFVPIVKVTNRNTRAAHGKCMRVVNLRSDMGRKAFTYMGPVNWNRLPLELWVIEKFDEFKKAISTQVHNLFGDHPT